MSKLVSLAQAMAELEATDAAAHIRVAKKAGLCEQHGGVVRINAAALKPLIDAKIEAQAAARAERKAKRGPEADLALIVARLAQVSQRRVAWREKIAALEAQRERTTDPLGRRNLSSKIAKAKADQARFEARVKLDEEARDSILRALEDADAGGASQNA